MPRAFDRFQPAKDHDPLRNVLDFENPQSAIGEGAALAGESIRQAAVVPPKLSFANLWKSWFGTDAVDGGTPDEMWTLGLAIKELTTEHTAAIADLKDIAVASRATQAYVADIDDMASCARQDLAMFGYGTQKYIDILTGVYCAFDDHFHTVGTTCYRPTTFTGETTGDIIYTPIIVNRVGHAEGVRWIVGADTAIASIDYYEMALCAYNPTSGNIEKLWGSGNIKDGLPSTTSMAEAYVAFGFDPPQETAPGQILFVAHQQTAPGVLQIGRRFAAAINPPVGRPGQLLDAACFVAPRYSQGIPSSISFASLNRENRFIPWTAVKVSALPEEP